VIVPVAAPFGEKLRDHRRFDNNILGIGKVVRDLDPLAKCEQNPSNCPTSSPGVPSAHRNYPARGDPKAGAFQERLDTRL